ncbi:hypothetical protein CDCA_CDCA17G4349 [Cyanidium caldarium]|uniref:PsbB mRNA maturation factor Mbb1 n=1 Tax=Cyanidium caldarium TaxID=2771 RepID=A0AAV9J1Y0_CYACA|nr:hypothetical protein CDCA_CDCA17G4349 [Cyanidium caldarium]
MLPRGWQKLQSTAEPTHWDAIGTKRAGDDGLDDAERERSTSATADRLGLLPLEAALARSAANNGHTSSVASETKQRVQGLFVQARSAERRGDLRAAQDILHECIALDEHDAHSWLLLAKLESRRRVSRRRNGVTNGADAKADAGSAQAARDCFRRGVEHCPRSVHLLQAWAVFEQKQGDRDAARELFRRGLALEPSNSYIYQAWGLMEQRAGHVEEARALFEKSTLFGPTPEVCNAWGVLEASLGRFHLARCLFQLGYACATGHLRASFYVEPDTKRLRHRADDELREGVRKELMQIIYRVVAKRHFQDDATRLDDAMREVGSDRVACPSSYAAMEQVVKDSLMTRMNAAGASVVEAWIPRRAYAKRDVSDYGAINLLTRWGEAEERCGNFTRARQVMEMALGINANEPTAHVTLARLEFRRGAHKLARDLMRAAEALLVEQRKSAALGYGEPRVRLGRDASVHIAWATMEASLGNLAAADDILRRGDAMFPRDPALLQAWGILREKQGQDELARELYAKSIKARANAPAFVAWALLEERHHRIDEARRLFELALKVDAIHGPAYNAFGSMEARLGRLEAARRIFEKGIALDPCTAVFHGYGMMELRYGKSVEQARALFGAGLRACRGDTVFLWHSLGMLELHERNLDRARGVFGEALKRYPRNSRLLVGAALVEASTPNVKCHEQARELFRAAALSDTSHGHAWQSWGVFEMRQGNVSTARALFRRGLKHCPSHAPLWQALGVLEAHLNNLTQARAVFERGERVNPNHVYLLHAHACLEVREGNYDEARQLLRRALEVSPLHGPAWNAFGLLEWRRGKVNDARRLLEAGVQRDPCHAPLYYTLGRLEVNSSNYARARELFTTGLRMNPRHAPLYHSLAELEGMLGNVGGLQQLRRSAEKYFPTGNLPLSTASGNQVVDDFENEVDFFDDESAGEHDTPTPVPMERALEADERRRGSSGSSAAAGEWLPDSA